MFVYVFICLCVSFVRFGGLVDTVHAVSATACAGDGFWPFFFNILIRVSCYVKNSLYILAIPPMVQFSRSSAAGYLTFVGKADAAGLKRESPRKGHGCQYDKSGTLR